MLFLHFSRVGHASLGKAELSECQKRCFFGILLGCLHYHIIANAEFCSESLQNLKGFFGDPPLNPIFFGLTPL